MVVDFEKVSTCYNKYLFALKTVYQTIESEGRTHNSEYVGYSLGKEKRDRFKDSIFPLGGHPTSSGEIPWRRAFFESYHFSDPKKNVR